MANQKQNLNKHRRTKELLCLMQPVPHQISGMPTMKVQYLLKQWNDSGNELVITQNAYWRTKYIEPETTEISVSFMEYDYLVQSLGDQALDQIIIKREKAGISG